MKKHIKQKHIPTKKVNFMKKTKKELMLTSITSTAEGSTAYLEVCFSLAKHLRGAPINILNYLAEQEVKKMFCFPFATVDSVSWADENCKTIKKTVMLLLDKGKGLSLSVGLTDGVAHKLIS